jgi:hypothetical protein
MLAERDKHMSEQKTNYMAELDLWIEANVIGPIESASDSPQELEMAAEQVKKLIRAKVLESYHNGQAAGPSRAPRSAYKPRGR